MGETVTYLGHVDIVPSLNQSEYDYLYALTEPVGRHRRQSGG